MARPRVQEGPDQFVIHQGDTAPLFTHVCVDEDNVVVPLIGATAVTFLLRKRTAAPATALALVGGFGTKDNGEVKYAWQAGDTDTFGDYYGSFRVTMVDGTVRTFPPQGNLLIKIERALDE